MIEINDAFRKFRSNLELNQKEQDDASRRQQDIRALMAESFKREDDFLTGSYRRHTKTKPLKDVDIFFVLHEDEAHYRLKHPSVLLRKVESVLAEEYGRDSVDVQWRSVAVDFKLSGEADRVMSFDVVPAFAKDSHYEIPDTSVTHGWTETDPTVHADLAKKANDAFSGEWKGMVRMLKAWNNHHDRPVRPSFLLEVMALKLIQPPFGRDYAREFKQLFAAASTDIHGEWPDPAGLGPPVSAAMTTIQKEAASKALWAASEHCRNAIALANGGRREAALRVWRDEVFGDTFPLS